MSQDGLFAGKSVLLVEDEVALAEEIGNLLKTLGCSDVIFAPTLEDAADLAEMGAINVALLDVNLSEGLQTVALGHALSAQGVRVLFMSGFNAVEMARATRGFEFIEKPISLTRLKAALQRAILRTPAVRPTSQPHNPPP